MFNVNLIHSLIYLMHSIDCKENSFFTLNLCFFCDSQLNNIKLNYELIKSTANYHYSILKTS